MLKFTTLTFLIISLCAVEIHCHSYPVPIPAHRRQAVHGWLILPLDQNLPNYHAPSTPIDAWFSHHVPEFYEYSPHDFQILVRGTLTPLPTAGNETLPIRLPYPPHHELLQNEFTFTPPPPFSLNDLLSGDLTVLQGVVYNGSFDTSYERKPMAIATLNINELTTAVYLNDSTDVLPIPNLSYYSYPRSSSWNGQSVQHFYFAHIIHSKPDFDQVVHVSIDLTACSCLNTPCSDVEQTFDLISSGGQPWTFEGIQNLLNYRLLPSDPALTGAAQLSGDSSVVCPVKTLEQIHCAIGPRFNETCN